MIIRERKDHEHGWGYTNAFFIASKRIKGKIKATYNTDIRVRLFVECCKFQYFHIDGKVTKINIYYDESKIINDLKIAFYAEGRRGRIEESNLFVDEIVLDMNELVSENIYGPFYKNQTICQIYEMHYKAILGKWLYSRYTITNEISRKVSVFTETDSHVRLAELDMKLESLGNRPVNHHKLPRGIIHFIPIEQYEDEPLTTSYDFRSEK